MPLQGHRPRTAHRDGRERTGGSAGTRALDEVANCDDTLTHFRSQQCHAQHEIFGEIGSLWRLFLAELESLRGQLLSRVPIEQELDEIPEGVAHLMLIDESARDHAPERIPSTAQAKAPELFEALDAGRR